ncbi:hypothetical protein DMC30DRAFT_115571 [Rhodotorula diobovata]|uniref:Ubiquilin n=1 Tax=Rhodotorula diobovata TaxID=5288 RepID=A0A5C5G0W9_9BASI|nr:hypothetical protein DMC30DRAFT_115571 [Rhodotorula diobovata]
MSDSAEQFTLNIKGPSDLKLSVSVPSTATVADLKEVIAKDKEDFPIDQQRLIFSGRVLKNEDPLTKYGVKNGVAIHLVKGARPAGAAAAASTTPAARGPSEAAGVPSNFAAGQQVMGNPLAPLMNAQYAGALGGFNPFQQMGVNPNDPNYIQSMMNNPEVQAQMNQLLSDPAVIDQMIEASPELQQMGPMVRQMMQSPQFRQMLSNPQLMQQMTQMMRSGGGMPGMGGLGGFPGFGGAGAQGGQQGSAGAGAGMYNPWASTPASPPAAADAAGGAGAGAGAGGEAAAGSGSPPPPANPFAALLGAPGAGVTPGQQPDLGQAMAQLQHMQQLFGMGGAGAGAGGAAGAPQQSPEERYANELEQLRNMGFTNATRNVRALLASGGFLESAIAWLLENPE